MKVYKNLFEQIISVEHLFSSWDAFKSDKRNKRDVLAFEWHLEENIFKLHRELKNKRYVHGPYTGFYITDPKQRHIHKALVRDRALHHAIFSILNPIFEPTFISTSFSCRVGYGAHRGVAAVENMLRQVSYNGTRPCFALKCDIRKFFDSVDHKILLSILEKRIKDAKTTELLRSIADSYNSLPLERERDGDASQRYSHRKSYLPTLC